MVGRTTSNTSVRSLNWQINTRICPICLLETIPKIFLHDLGGHNVNVIIPLFPRAGVRCFNLQMKWHTETVRPLRSSIRKIRDTDVSHSYSTRSAVFLMELTSGTFRARFHKWETFVRSCDQTFFRSLRCQIYWASFFQMTFIRRVFG